MLLPEVIALPEQNTIILLAVVSSFGHFSFFWSKLAVRKKLKATFLLALVVNLVGILIFQGIYIIQQ